MKELSIEEKARRYDEAIKRAQAKMEEAKVFDYDDEQTAHIIRLTTTDIFPELKESEDERIKKVLIGWINLEPSTSFNDTFDGFSKEQILAWLEKQSYTKKDIDDAYLKGVTNTKNEMEKQYEANYQIRKDIATFIFNYRGDIKDRAKWMNYLGIKVSFVEKQGEQNHFMIQWKGDNLKEVIDFTGKDKNFEKWFKSFEEYEKYVQEHDGIFKLFNADGSHYEVPVGAWIVKTPDGYNVASKAVFKQKSVDTPKFKVGDWVVSIVSGGVYKITGLNSEYELTSLEGKYKAHLPIKSANSIFRLWSIIDAKPGDVLVNGSNIFIFSYLSDTRTMGYCHINLDDGRFYDDKGKNECFGLIDAIFSPATKEQRDILFKAMADAGYAFDFEKKELEKIKNRPLLSDFLNAEYERGKADALKCVRWSEEDEKIGKELMDFCIKCGQGHTIVNSQDDFRRWTTWLKSLKDRYTWKPSDEQMDALHYVTNFDYGGHKATLVSLYEQLKKLRKE